MPQEINEAAPIQQAERYRVSVEMVLDQYQKMHIQTVYDLALSRAGVDELADQVQTKDALLRNQLRTETEMTNEIADLTAKLTEAERIMREQGQIIERYRMAYGNPPELIMSDDDDNCTDGRSMEVEDEVFSGKAERKAVHPPRKR